MNKLLRGTVVRRLKIKDFLEGGGYNKWLDVDEGSLQFYRAGKQARFRFTVSGITIDGPMVRIVGENTLLPVAYEDVVIPDEDDGEQVSLPVLRSGGYRQSDMTRERRKQLFREFRAKELDYNQEEL